MSNVINMLYVLVAVIRSNLFSPISNSSDCVRSDSIANSNTVCLLIV